MVEGELSVTMQYRLTLLFESKGWEIEDKHDNPNSLFNRFCSLFTVLNKEEQEFIYNLTKEGFHRIDFADYPIIINFLLTKLHTNYQHIKKIYVAPLTNKDDINKIKSSSVVSYLFKSVNVIQNFSGNDVTIIDCLNSIERYKHRINDNNNAILLLVDDFIGSGETAHSCIKYIKKHHNIKNERIIVTSISAQNIGIELIEELGYKTLVYLKKNRGISDRYNTVDSERYKEMMAVIGNKIGINKKNNLGYNETESLISLIRTPNNTFPIYWYNKKKHRHDVPFPRYTK